jgi:hypothetical protein
MVGEMRYCEGFNLPQRRKDAKFCEMYQRKKKMVGKYITAGVRNETPEENSVFP